MTCPNCGSPLTESREGQVHGGAPDETWWESWGECLECFALFNVNEGANNADNP